MNTLTATVEKELLFHHATANQWMMLHEIENDIVLAGGRVAYVTEPSFFRRYTIAGPDDLIKQWKELMAKMCNLERIIEVMS